MRNSSILIFIVFLLVGTINAQTTQDRLDFANELYYSNPKASFQIYDSIAGALDGKNYKELGYAKIGQGRYLLLKARLDESLKLLNEALDILEKHKDFSGAAKCHSLKSILLFRISDTEKGFYHSKKSVELYALANDTKGEISALTNLAYNYIENNQPDTAFIYLLKLKRSQNNMKETSKYFMYQNFGLYYKTVKKFNAALNAFSDALKIAKDNKMIDSETSCYKSIAETYIDMKDYTNAEKQLLLSIAKASENNLLHETNEAYNSLIKIKELKGDYKEAFRLDKINDLIEKEIYNLEKINKINEIDSQLKLTEQEKIISLKELEIKEEQVHTLEAKSKITQLIFIVVFSILIIIFIIIVLLRARKLNNKINAQKMMLEQKNTEITDSINYAQRIQSAILPSDDYFSKNLPNSFILYKPKDIVAGDFYWMHVIDGHVLYATADCTGHGVPGAMVSVVCSNSLNQSIKELKTSNTGEILEMTRTLVKENFNSDDKNVKDGMDLTLCALDLKTKKMQFTGANNPLYILRENNIIEIKGDKQPVGNHINEKPFTSHTIQLQKDDVVYTFSDGYVDQFGGEKGKKFMRKRFKELLLSVASNPMKIQKQLINSAFEDWKGELEQLDDVCVIGVRV
jgi:serine phosphatase RsbU (regulator of sigma subunit)